MLEDLKGGMVGARWERPAGGGGCARSCWIRSRSGSVHEQVLANLVRGRSVHVQVTAALIPRTLSLGDNTLGLSFAASSALLW